VLICTDLSHDLESKSQLEWWYVLIYHMTWNRSHNFSGDMYWFTTWPGIEVTTWVVICTDLPHDLESKSQLEWWYVLIYHMTCDQLWPFVVVINIYLCNQCISPLTLWVRTLFRRGVLDTTLCDKVCQSLATGRWFSPGTLVSSTNHDIAEVVLKVALNTINQQKHKFWVWFPSVVRCIPYNLMW
jgi:hypothetical protein